jgi:hypothetical protein
LRRPDLGRTGEVTERERVALWREHEGRGGSDRRTRRWDRWQADRTDVNPEKVQHEAHELHMRLI